MPSVGVSGIAPALHAAAQEGEHKPDDAASGCAASGANTPSGFRFATLLLLLLLLLLLPLLLPLLLLLSVGKAAGGDSSETLQRVLLPPLQHPSEL